MTRFEKILRHVNKGGRGVEIGPSYNPAAPKNQGYQVEVIDYLTREQLLRHYAEHNEKHPNKVGLENIEEVDYVWKGEPYAELTGKPGYYDWVIASHVIEHAPDLVALVNDCDAILKEDGVLSLAVPDHRYCFDCFRPVTGIGRVIDGHFRKDTVHTPGTVAESYLNSVNRAGAITWGDDDPAADYQFSATLPETLAAFARARGGAHLDSHAWCFTPHSFRLMMHDLHSLGLIRLREIEFHPREHPDCEFFVTLGRRGGGPPLGRLEMLRKSREEEAEWAARAAREQLDTLLGSRSWRLTAPLRGVASRLRRAAPWL
jgi:hypothetical protein